MSTSTKYRLIVVFLTVLVSIILVSFVIYCTSSNPFGNVVPQQRLYQVPIIPRVQHKQWSPNYNTELVKQSLRKKGHSLSNLPPWSALWTDKVHLCIMFNLNRIEPSQNIADLLVAYYYPFFRNITFIFDGNRNRPSYVPDFIGFISCDSHVGWYQQKCIRSCIQGGEDKDTKGYLYIADDMFINISKMADLPPEKVWYIWYGETFKYSYLLNPGPEGYHWVWWGRPLYNAKKLEMVINSLPAEWMEQLKRYAGFPDNFKARSSSDIIYIPQSRASKMISVLNHIIQTTDLFCEVATGLAVNIVAPDMILFSYGYLWGDKSINAIIKTSKTGHFVHPIKLGIESHRNLWIQFMETQLENVIINL